MSDPLNRGERRGHGEPESERELGPSRLIYSKDPWDERRFSPFDSLRRGRTTSWEAAAPYLLILGGMALLGSPSCW